MKRALSYLVIVLLLSGAIVAAEGPIDKGSMIIEGDVYFQHQSGELWDNWQGEGQTTIVISPSLGFFVTNGFMLGGQLYFLGISQGTADLTSVIIGPVVGYYFNTDPTRTRVKGAVYPYVTGGFGFGNVSNGDSADLFSIGMVGGAVFMVSNAVGVDVGLRLQSDRLSNGGSASGTTIWFGAGITAFIW